MHTIEDMKQSVATLVETDRALASDLDASRRVVGSIGRKRDALRRDISRLRCESERAMSAETVGEWRDDVERLTRTLERERSQLAELQDAQTQLLRDAERDREDLHHADERIAALTVALHRAEQERDAARLELQEAKSAMAEIRSSLQSSLYEARNAEEADQILYG